MAGSAGLSTAADLMLAGQRELASLAALLAATMPGQSVHGARRRIKQLRSLLRLLRDDIGEQAHRSAAAALRRAAAALAGHRRAEALVAAAGKLETARAAPGFWLSLAQAHRDAHAAAEPEPMRALAEARAAIDDAVAALAGARPAGDRTLPEAFLATYRKARRRLRRGLASGEAEALHAARTFVIHHLHHLQLLQPGRHRRLAALETLREALGDLNDLDELQQLAAGKHVSGAAVRRMEKARRRLLHRAEAAARPLFRHRAGWWRKRLRHAADRVLPAAAMG